MPLRATWDNTRAVRRRCCGEHEPELHCSFHQKQRVSQGEQAWGCCLLCLSLLTGMCLRHSPGSVLLVLPHRHVFCYGCLGKRELIPRCLRYIIPSCLALEQWGQGNRSSGLVGLLSKGESFLISKNQLTQRDSLSLVREILVTRASRIQKI